MTKVLENGQLEWIFDDLDFEGAYSVLCGLLQSTMVKIDDCCSKLEYLIELYDRDVIDFEFKSAEFNRLHVEYDRLNRKWENYLECRNYVHRLRMRKSFVLPKDSLL